MKRRQVVQWAMLDMRRLDPNMPGMLLEERRLFGRTAPDPSGLSRCLMSSQIVNVNLEGMTATADDLTAYELVGPPGRLDESMRRSLQLYFKDLNPLWWEQVPVMELA